MSIVRNSFRDRREGYTEKAVAIRLSPSFYLSLNFPLHWVYLEKQPSFVNNLVLVSLASDSCM